MYDTERRLELAKLLKLDATQDTQNAMQVVISPKYSAQFQKKFEELFKILNEGKPEFSGLFLNPIDQARLGLIPTQPGLTAPSAPPMPTSMAQPQASRPSVAPPPPAPPISKAQPASPIPTAPPLMSQPGASAAVTPPTINVPKLTLTQQIVGTHKALELLGMIKNEKATLPNAPGGPLPLPNIKTATGIVNTAEKGAVNYGKSLLNIANVRYTEMGELKKDQAALKVETTKLEDIQQRKQQAAIGMAPKPGQAVKPGLDEEAERAAASSKATPKFTPTK
jgi:hypothetical protein